MTAADQPELEAQLTRWLDEGALAKVATAVVRDYGPGILGYLASVLRDDEQAREAFSTFGEELWKALPRYERRSPVRTWAYAIAYRCALRQRRTGARRRTRPLRDTEWSKIAATVETTALSFARTEAEKKLDVLRRALDEEQQSLLVLRLDRGMSWNDIAEVLGKSSPAALRKRFERLKERLRELAEREGLVRGTAREP